MKILFTVVMIAGFALSNFSQSVCEDRRKEQNRFQNATAAQRLELVQNHLQNMSADASFGQAIMLNDISNQLTELHYTAGNILPPPVSYEQAKAEFGAGTDQIFSGTLSSYMELPDMGNACTCNEPRDCGKGRQCLNLGSCDATWFGCGFLWLDACYLSCFLPGPIISV